MARLRTVFIGTDDSLTSQHELRVESSTNPKAAFISLVTSMSGMPQWIFLDKSTAMAFHKRLGAVIDKMED